MAWLSWGTELERKMNVPDVIHLSSNKRNLGREIFFDPKSLTLRVYFSFIL